MAEPLVRIVFHGGWKRMDHACRAWMDLRTATVGRRLALAGRVGLAVDFPRHLSLFIRKSWSKLAFSSRIKCFGIPVFLLCGVENEHASASAPVEMRKRGTHDAIGSKNLAGRQWPWQSDDPDIFSSNELFGTCRRPRYPPKRSGWLYSPCETMPCVLVGLDTLDRPILCAAPPCIVIKFLIMRARTCQG